MLLRAALASLLVAAAPAAAQEVPLFELGRSLNANVVEYAARVGPDGRLRGRTPIDVYWLLRAEDGRREGLNLFERLFAYGAAGRFDGQGGQFHLVSLPARELSLRRGPRGWEADTAIAGESARLERIFVTTEGGAGAHVRFVELWGERLADGAPAYERLVP